MLNGRENSGVASTTDAGWSPHTDRVTDNRVTDNRVTDNLENKNSKMQKAFKVKW